MKKETTQRKKTITTLEKESEILYKSAQVKDIETRLKIEKLNSIKQVIEATEIQTNDIGTITFNSVWNDKGRDFLTKKMIEIINQF